MIDIDNIQDVTYWLEMYTKYFITADRYGNVGPRGLLFIYMRMEYLYDRLLPSLSRPGEE